MSPDARDARGGTHAADSGTSPPSKPAGFSASCLMEISSLLL